MEELIITYILILGIILVLKLTFKPITNIDGFEKWILSSLYHAWIGTAIIVICLMSLSYFKTGDYRWSAVVDLVKGILQ
jgi:hypothetical protein